MTDKSIHELNMAYTTLLIIFASSVVFYAVSNIIHNLFIHPLKKFPGPKLWACTSIPWVIHLFRGASSRKLHELHQKYGDSVRVAPNEVSVINPTAIKNVLAHRLGHKEFPKIVKVPALNGVLGIITASQADHSRFRRVLSNSFSDRSIRSQEPILQQYANLLINGLAENESKGPQNMVKWFNWTTFDLTGRLAFGEAFGCLETQQTHPWITAVFGNTKAMQFTQFVQTYGIQKYVMPFVMTENAVKVRQKNWQYTSDRIDSRIKMGTHNGDFWDHVLEKSNEDSGKGMDIEEMKANASQIMLAGSETTATLLSGCIFLLLQHHDAMTKVKAEIRGKFKSFDEIDLHSIEDLPYSIAVLNETMRIYPPVSTQLTRVSPQGGETIEGRYIPEGTSVFICQYAANRQESSFTRPLEFLPERFLKEGEFKNDNLAALQPFSMGSRNCIGKNLAYSEMRLLLVKTLWKFDMELDPRSKNWIGEQKTFTLWEKGPLWVNLKSVA